MNRVEYWDSLPEKEWPRTAGLGLWDRRNGIRTVASMLTKPKALEIGVDRAGVLEYCHEVFGSYTGVDIALKKEAKEITGISCPYKFVEAPSVNFWKLLRKTDTYDFVYVDGHHGTRETHLDITQAMLRLNVGGYIMVHDIANHDVDTGPAWAYNRCCNLPGWYARILEGHGEGMAIFFKEAE